MHTLIPESALNIPEEVTVKRALISVSDKTNLVPFAQRLHALGIEIISTGGTAKMLREANLTVTDVSEVTGFPEILDGRVKTLHPAIHGAILARPTDPTHHEQLQLHHITPIQLVVVNLYPFEAQLKRPELTEAEAIEFIDIGGPTLMRAAAKNFYHVGIVSDPSDYEEVARTLSQSGGKLSLDLRRKLAQKAFAHTAAYDATIARYLQEQDTQPLPTPWIQVEPLAHPLRYGENPHQKAAFYGAPEKYFRQLHGKALSYNNILDLSAALYLIGEFVDYPPTCAILKHTNPCGVATRPRLSDAYQAAFQTDTRSPFGGIVVVNRPLDLETATFIDKIFTEVIIAPDFEPEVLDFLKRKKNRRIIQALQPIQKGNPWEQRSVMGGLLVQERDASFPDPETLRTRFKVVTHRAPTSQEWTDLDFAWRIVKHVKSNAIVYVREGATLGIGAGQMSRVDASEIAVWKGRKAGLNFANSVVASDAFFPFADGVEAAAAVGATAVIQPGGSIRDAEVIEAANSHDMAMVFTGTRHFKH